MTRRDIFKLLAVAGIPSIKSVERLTIEPGDIAVLKFEQQLSEKQAVCLRAQWAEKFSKIPMIVLDAGASIEVLRRS